MVSALHWLQRRMIWLLLSTYLLGALLPRAGIRMRSVAAGAVPLPGGGTIVLTLPMLMLGLLLVVAGLGTNLRDLQHTLRRGWLLAAGLVANTLYPILFAVVVSVLLLPWHTPDEAQSILVGLAMIGAMPIAGASTAWSQNAEGNLALSLGLVLVSTILSPLLTPIGLHAVGAITQGDYSEDLHELAQSGSSAFVAFAVVIPSLLGIAVRAVVGTARVTRLLPALKMLNLANLLLLTYSNAAVALPQTVRDPDYDFLALTILITSCMCAGAFAMGLGLARRFRSDRADETALMYGLGMNNNGTGLVLAASALADHPVVMLPIIIYNLVQQIAAAVVDALRRRRRPD